MKLEHNANQVARRYRNVQQAVKAELVGELAGLAAEVAARMRLEAPKFRSTMANSVRVEQRGALSYFVGPGVDYALRVDKGRKPGKGLPRFHDPQAASLLAWLEANPKVAGDTGPVKPRTRRARVGSMRRMADELALKDRYMAFSRHVKAHGLKANPFVRRTADAFRSEAPQRLAAAVRRGVQAFNAGSVSV